MPSKGRTALRIGAVLVGLGALAWNQLHRPKPDAGDTETTSESTPATAPLAPAKPETWQLGSLTLTPCELGQPNSGMTTAAWCAPFEVPENRDDPHSRKIQLKLGVIRSSAQVASKDIIVPLAGGPGQAATESWPGMAGALQALLSHRHVLLLDQRGTGGSHPLTCKNDKAVKQSDDVKQSDEEGPFDPDKVGDEAARCLKQLDGRADPRFYTTTIAAEDLEDVRKALGSPTFDLVGVSYGTRMAQEYLRRHPDAVRSVILDGVVPNELALGQDFALNLEQALKAQFARCSEDEHCHKRFGDPYQTLYQLRDALRANPHEVSFRDPQNYQTVKRVLSEYALTSVVRLFAYTPVTAALLPVSIDAAAHGDVGPLLGQAKLLSGDLSDTMNGGMQMSVICSEDADLLKARPEDAQTMLGTRMVDAIEAMCSAWPKGSRPKDFHEPTRSDKPFLLLSGEFDPVTPPRYGEEVMKGLSHARHLVLKGQGHNVIGAGCAPDVVKDFIENNDPAKLNVKCLDRLHATPVFIDFNGAAP